MKERLTGTERDEYRKAYEGSYLPNWQYARLEQSEKSAWNEVDRLNKQLTEKDATIKGLRKALEETRISIGNAINSALGEDDKE